MSHLIATYAAAAGLKISYPELNESFYPLSCDRYITLQTGSGQRAKNYDFFQEVLVQIKPLLDSVGIPILHLGHKDDPPVQGVLDLRGKTTIAQSNYIIKRTQLHLGNDSWIVHCAGWNKRPIVALYGSTSVQNHGPYWYDSEKTVLISSHRNGGVPTYSAQENPKTINLIPPEVVSNSVLGLLGIGPSLNHQSRLFGLIYAHALFEVVPNSFPAPTFVPESPMTVRMDYLFNEEVLVNFLKTGRKVNIITNRPIDQKILHQFKKSILTYTHEIDSQCPLQYAGTMPGIIQHTSFFTKEKDESKIAALRYQFFDICKIEKVNDLSKSDYLTAALSYLNWPEGKKLDLEREINDNKLSFKSNKYILSDGKIFLSPAHLKVNTPINSFTDNIAPIIDDPSFWRDLNHYHLFYQP